MRIWYFYALLMMEEIFKNLILVVHHIFSSLVYHINHIIFKNQKNVCNPNLLIIILFRMVYIIIKFTVHNLSYITLIHKDHINVLNNVHQTHIGLIINLITIVLLNVLII